MYRNHGKFVSMIPLYVDYMRERGRWGRGSFYYVISTSFVSLLAAAWALEDDCQFHVASAALLGATRSVTFGIFLKIVCARSVISHNDDILNTKIRLSSGTKLIPLIRLVCMALITITSFILSYLEWNVAEILFYMYIHRTTYSLITAYWIASLHENHDINIMWYSVYMIYSSCHAIWRCVPSCWP